MLHSRVAQCPRACGRYRHARDSLVYASDIRQLVQWYAIPQIAAVAATRPVAVRSVGSPVL